MNLVLHYHPLSSYCHKVLVALYELGVPFEAQLLDLGDAQQRAAFVALWPTGKMPLLVDGGHVVPETSIIIEYLARHHAPGAQTLLPAHANAGTGGPADRAALDPSIEVRLMDRLFDLYVMTPLQAIVADRLRDAGQRDPLAVEQARATLAMAYGMLEQRLGDRSWAAGGDFSMADCAAAPSLFYALTLVPLGPEHVRLGAYFERLMQRPSVARVLEEARPWFKYYPFHEALPERFQPLL